jgi:hypothetical protein
VTPERRARALRAARTFALCALAVETLAILALFFDVRAVVLGTLACAGLALGCFYGAFEGFDEALRRPK